MIYGEDKPSLFLTISEDVRSAFKKEILLDLNNFTDPKIIQQTANFIGDLSSSLYNEEKGVIQNEHKWGELVNHLFELYQTNEKKSMIIALMVFEQIFDNTSDKLVHFKT